MARNTEKANTMYNKWQELKKSAHAEGVATRRPVIASQCESLGEAEKWRRELLQDMTKKIAMIQNGALGEHRIRELNDDINKLSRTKWAWDGRIRELGGADYRRMKSALDLEGKILPGSGSGGGAYKYYGAAKDLPGVREIFAEAEAHKANEKSLTALKRSRKDLYRDITPEYYGFVYGLNANAIRKGEGKLTSTITIANMEEEEAAREKELRDEEIAAYQAKKSRAEEDMARSGGVFGAADIAELARIKEEEDDEIDINVIDGLGSATSDASIRSYVELPSEEDILRVLTEEKKKTLLAQFM